MSFRFEDARLEDFDSSKPLPANSYEVQLKKVEPVPYVDKRTNEEAVRVKVGLQIVNDPQFAGRWLNDTFFPSVGTGKILARLAHVLQFPQEDGESVIDWLKRLATAVPPITFNVVVTLQDDAYLTEKNGEPTQSNRIAWFEVSA